MPHPARGAPRAAEGVLTRPHGRCGFAVGEHRHTVGRRADAAIGRVVRHRPADLLPRRRLGGPGRVGRARRVGTAGERRGAGVHGGVRRGRHRGRRLVQLLRRRPERLGQEVTPAGGGDPTVIVLFSGSCGLNGSAEAARCRRGPDAGRFPPGGPGLGRPRDRRLHQRLREWPGMEKTSPLRGTPPLAGRTRRGRRLAYCGSWRDCSDADRWNVGSGATARRTPHDGAVEPTPPPPGSSRRRAVRRRLAPTPACGRPRRGSRAGTPPDHPGCTS